MKLKEIFTPLFFILLGTAFLVVSLWAFLSKNKNAKAIKYKYKLGGIILTLTFFASGCSDDSKTQEEGETGEIVTCYDPIPSDWFVLDHSKDVYYKGDTVFFSIEAPTYKYYSYQVMDSTSKEVLQDGLLKYLNDENQYIIPINPVLDYNGICEIIIYGEQSEEIRQERYIHSSRTEIAIKED